MEDFDGKVCILIKILKIIKFQFQLDVFVEAIMKALKEGYLLSEYPSPHSSSPIGREGRIYGIG